MTPTLQKIIIALVALLTLGFFGYSMFTNSSLNGTQATSTAHLVGHDTLTLVEKLKTISIDQEIFSNALFTNLKDFTQTISPELQGRANPFATIGSDIFVGKTQ